MKLISYLLLIILTQSSLYAMDKNDDDIDPKNDIIYGDSKDIEDDIFEITVNFNRMSLQKNMSDMILGAITKLPVIQEQKTLTHFTPKKTDTHKEFRVRKVLDYTLDPLDTPSNNKAPQKVADCDLPPLHKAAYENNTLKIKHFHSMGAPLDRTNAQGDTALHVAIRCGNIRAIKCLLNLGAKTGLTNKMGESVLYLATIQGSEEIKRLFK